MLFFDDIQTNSYKLNLQQHSYIWVVYRLGLFVVLISLERVPCRNPRNSFIWQRIEGDQSANMKANSFEISSYLQLHSVKDGENHTTPSICWEDQYKVNFFYRNCPQTDSNITAAEYETMWFSVVYNLCRATKQTQKLILKIRHYISEHTIKC